MHRQPGSARWDYVEGRWRARLTSCELFSAFSMSHTSTARENCPTLISTESQAGRNCTEVSWQWVINTGGPSGAVIQSMYLQLSFCFKFLSWEMGFCFYVSGRNVWSQKWTSGTFRMWFVSNRPTLLTCENQTGLVNTWPIWSTALWKEKLLDYEVYADLDEYAEMLYL